MVAIRILAGTLALFILTLHPTLTRAATLHVGVGQPHATIQGAVNASTAGDSIVIHDGTYVENVTVSQSLFIVSKDFLDNGEYDGAILDAGSNYMTGLWISLADGTTVEGLSFTHAEFPAYAIHVDNSNWCRFTNNRIGWDESNMNGTALYLSHSNGCVVEDNLISRAVNQGVFIDQCIGTEVHFNTFHNVYGTQGYAVALAGMYDVSIEGSNCQMNSITHNEFTTNWVGVYASGYVTDNEVRDNVFTDNVRGVFLGPGGLRYNIVARNDFSMNDINIVLDGAGANTIIDNILDGEGTGIWLGYQAPYAGSDNFIAWNAIRNHALGMWIGNAANNNFIFGNSFLGNTVNVEDHHVVVNRVTVAAPQLNATNWGSPTALSYFYGQNHRNMLGNYYSSYTGTDTDGDGVGDTGLPFDDGDPTSGPSEYYPLISPPDQYSVEAWYLDADSPQTMYHRDRTRPVRHVDMEASGQLIWVSDKTANGNIDYANGVWTGCLSFDGFPSPGDLTLEIGSSSNGTDFTASGAQASIGGSSMNIFETTSAAVSIPDGHYLAVRVTNNMEYPHKLLAGSLTSYVSSTGNGDPEWPGGATGIRPTVAPQLTLGQNWPNPFNPLTTIEFTVPQPAFATLAVYNIRGQHIVTLVSETVGAGVRVVRWDGRDERGNAASSGIYFYRLRVGEDSITKKMLLLK